MTKTIDEQLERFASAQERSAVALEGILEALTNGAVVGSTANNTSVADVSTPEDTDAGTSDETTTEEVSNEEAETPEVQEEAPTAEPEPEPEDSGSQDEPAEAEAAGEESDEGDPLGDGGTSSDPYALPEKLTNDTLRGFARDLMEKEGKAAVFEVLAESGKGYKAVGEVSKDDLREAHENMANRLRG